MNFRIARYDARNWVLEEFLPGGLHPVTRQQGKGKWEAVGYYGKLEDLAIALLNRQIEVPDGTLQNQVKDLLVEIQAAEIRIAEELKQVTAEAVWK